MNRISLKQTRKAPTSYWIEFFEFAEKLCEGKDSVEEIFEDIKLYKDENLALRPVSISLFNSHSGKGKKMVIAFTHGTSNGGDQIASISENYLPHEKLLIEDKCYLLIQQRGHFNVFEETFPFNLKAWLQGNETFEEAANAIRAIAKEKMERRKQWTNQIGFKEGIEGGMPTLLVHSIHYNSPFLKLLKKREVQNG